MERGSGLPPAHADAAEDEPDRGYCRKDGLVIGKPVGPESVAVSAFAA